MPSGYGCSCLNAVNFYAKAEASGETQTWDFIEHAKQVV